MRIKIILVYCLLYLYGCQSVTDTGLTNKPVADATSELKWELTTKQTQWVERTLNAMTVEQKIGQLLAPAIGPGKGNHNPEIAEQVAEWIEQYHIGHVYVAEQ